MAHFDELMQRALTVRNNVAPSSNTAILVGGVLVSIVSALQLLLDDKQDELTFDTAPTADSQNPVTSDGIYQALQAIDLSACEKIVNKVTSINAQSTDVQYPSAKLLYDSLQALSGIYAAIVHTHVAADITDLSTVLSVYESLSNKVAAVDAQSTDDQYPTAKLLFDISQTVDAYLANLDARVTSLENDPPVTYIIRGTSSNVGGTETFRIRFIAKGASTPAAYQNVTVNVDAFGVWQLKYVNKYLYALDSFATNNTTLLTIDFSNADDLTQLTTLRQSFYGCNNLTYVDIRSQNLNALTNASQTFYGCASLSRIDLASAMFATISTTERMFYGCTSLTTIDLSAANFAVLTDARGMFAECSNLVTINWSSQLSFDNLTQIGGENLGIFRNCAQLTNAAIAALATQSFAALQYAREAFYGCTTLTTIDLSAATFASLVGARMMFSGCSAVANITMPNATFASLDIAYQMFNGCSALTTLNMAAATFEAVTDSRQAFFYCAALVDISLSVVDKAISTSVSAANGSINLRYCQMLSYNSMLAMAKWVNNFTNFSAQTITFNTTAWNNLQQAEKDAIDAELQCKNWTRVLA